MRLFAPRGFTLIEVMVVLVITLIVMGMLASFFVATTKVVTTVELKLRLNEQARGILDALEEHILCACADERGGQFAVKGVTFTDGDFDGETSDALDIKGKVSKTGANSKRNVDALYFAQTSYVGKTIMNQYPPMGGYPYPLNDLNVNSNAAGVNGVHEFYTVALLSNIHHALQSVHNTNAIDFNVPDVATETLINADVSRLCYSLQKREFHAQVCQKSTSGFYTPSDPVPHPLEPGYELGGAYLEAAAVALTPPSFRFLENPGAIFENVYVMDLSIAVWDETDRRFHRVPHLHAVYFAPIPKAILIGITVCDLRKKGRISYSRIIRPPTGGGNGHFDATLANADTGATTKAFALTINTKNPGENVTSFHSLPAPYNRLKRLRTDPTVAGDLDPSFLDTTIFKQ